MTISLQCYTGVCMDTSSILNTQFHPCAPLSSQHSGYSLHVIRVNTMSAVLRHNVRHVPSGIPRISFWRY